MWKSWWGQVPTGGLWNSAIYGKKRSGASVPNLPGQWTLCSARVLAFRIRSGSGPLVLLAGGGETLVPGVIGGQKSLLCTCYSCMT